MERGTRTGRLLMTWSAGTRGGSSPAPEFPERLQRLLALLVRAYIQRGEPVSSLWLARESPLGVSSATVRNMLGQLETLGYVQQPHSSAGRVPTDQAYRFHVDMLLHTRRPPRDLSEAEARLRRVGSVDDVLSEVSHELSRAAHSVGFAVSPDSEAARLRRIEFVALDAARVLVILVAADGQVTHTLLELDEETSPAELTQAANYLNQEFAGRTLIEMRVAVLERLARERVLYDRLLARALRLAQSSLADLSPPGAVFIHGASSLIDESLAQGSRLTLEALRTLIAMMEEKHRLVRILDEYIDAPGLTVVIGTEHTDPTLQRFSLVFSTFMGGDRNGAVGVIGPTRMRYSRAIAAVDRASQAVSRVLVTGAGPNQGAA
ncbi:MAG: heat-inducible transcription repressor HrcA [Luteitalea sp.]|nr:heat-inducible transcription repressor HrcA [Luteitalea sp.]